MALAFATFFAAPLLHFASEPGGGNHLYGPSTVGKTMASDAGQSIYGWPLETADNAFGVTWAGSEAGFDALALARTDLGLPLDEITLADRRSAEQLHHLPSIMIRTGTSFQPSFLHAARRRWPASEVPSGATAMGCNRPRSAMLAASPAMSPMHLLCRVPILIRDIGMVDTVPAGATAGIFSLMRATIVRSPPGSLSLRRVGGWRELGLGQFCEVLLDACHFDKRPPSGLARPIDA
jgi:hypothetical protein